MKNTTRITSLPAIALIGALVLTGCTAGGETEPTPSETPSAAASATQSPTPAPTEDAHAEAPTQDPVPVPESEQEAITQATKVVEQYLDVEFELQQNLDLGLSYVENFVVPQSALHRLLEDTVSENSKNGASVSGKPLMWSTRDELSYTTPSTDQATGNEYEFGAVVLAGCLDNTGTEFLQDGEPNSEVPKGVFPEEFHLFYIAQTGTWLITEDNPGKGFQC